MHFSRIVHLPSVVVGIFCNTMYFGQLFSIIGMTRTCHSFSISGMCLHHQQQRQSFLLLPPSSAGGGLVLNGKESALLYVKHSVGGRWIVNNARKTTDNYRVLEQEAGKLQSWWFHKSSTRYTSILNPMKRNYYAKDDAQSTAQIYIVNTQPMI